MQRKEAISSLVAWASEKGYSVDFHKDSENGICQISKLIEINSAASTETQLYCLLHECGHILIFEHGSPYDFKFIRNNFSESSDTYKVFRVIEEAEAWLRAKKLAKRLGIEVDDDKWIKEMSKALKKYIVWASD